MAGRKSDEREILTIPARIDGIWVETVVATVRHGEYEAHKFTREFAGTGVEGYLKEDVEFWRSKGYEVIVIRER